MFVLFDEGCLTTGNEVGKMTLVEEQRKAEDHKMAREYAYELEREERRNESISSLCQPNSYPPPPFGGRSSSYQGGGARTGKGASHVPRYVQRPFPPVGRSSVVV